MADLDELLGQIPVDQIAGRLGVDEATAHGAVQQALPGLLAGLQHNVASGAQGGEGGLLSALESHAGTGLLDGGVNVDDVDVADGEKIVGKAFGGQTDTAAAQLAGGVGGADLVKKVLPYLAPIVMAFLAKKVFSGGGGQSSSAASAADDGAGGLGGVLGGVLGGSGGSGASGGGLGDLLGGLLGGSSGGGGLGGILGGLFGGGK